MAGGDQLIAGTDTQIKVAGRLFFELDAEAFGFLLGIHILIILVHAPKRSDFRELS